MALFWTVHISFWGVIYVAKYTLILKFPTHWVMYFYFPQNYLLKL